MLDYICNPNLPKNRITTCIVSGQYQSVLDDLHELLIETILIPPCFDLQKGVSCHADMVSHHLGGKQVLLYDYSDTLNQQLLDLGFEIISIEKPLLAEYPQDIRLNAARVGKYVICNRKYTDCTILYQMNNENVISVAQGYAKCSTLIVDENSIITADNSIATCAKKHELNVLQIEQGHILLEGYNYGFIGGCGTKIDASTMYFTGDISNHPNVKQIKEFLTKRGIDIICGSAKQLIDVGSILPLLQK